MGLLDALKQYLSDAAPGGLLNQEWTPENVRNAGEAMSMIPNPAGDIASGLLAVDDLKKGNYGEAALNGLGLLPFVPAMGGIIKKVGNKEMQELLKYGQEADDYLYHVAPSTAVKQIMESGLQPKPLGRMSTFSNPTYRQYGIGKAFLTERDGVPFWVDRVENHLFDQFDKPPAVKVVKIPKKDIKTKLNADEIGTQDSKHPAWYVTETIPVK